MTVLRYLGAAYLIWTGVRLWTAEPVVPNLQAASGSDGLAKVFATGVALNLGNPKMPLFYLALLPNLAGTAPAFSLAVELAIVIVAIEVVVIGAHVLLAVRARRLLHSPRIVRRANRMAGSVMVGAGVAVVASR